MSVTTLKSKNRMRCSTYEETEFVQRNRERFHQYMLRCMEICKTHCRKMFKSFDTSEFANPSAVNHKKYVFTTDDAMHFKYEVEVIFTNPCCKTGAETYNHMDFDIKIEILDP